MADRDDDVLTIGAVERVLGRLRQSPDVDLVALNVAYEPAAARPSTEQAEGGVTSLATRKLRSSNKDGIVPFEELFEGPCADLTAMYSIVLRRSLWQQHYPVASTATPFSSVESTYPHAVIIAENLARKTVGLIAQPSVVIYEMPSEQFSWAKYHAKTVLIYFTELLQRYERGGVPYSVLQPYYHYQLLHRSGELGDLIFNRQSAGGVRDGLKFLWLYRRFPLRLLRSLLIALAHPAAPRIFSVPLRWWLDRRSQH